MKKSIWILLALTMSIAIVPSRTLAQDAPAGGGESSGSAPAEGDATAPVEETAADGTTAEESEEDGEALDAPTGTATEGGAAASTEEADAATEEEEASEEEAPAAPAVVPLFRGSMFSWQQGLTIASMAPGLLQTYNPTYYWSFFVQPRINLDAQNFFVLTLGMAIEWTNSDMTVHEREPQLYDTTIEYRHLERWEGFVFLPSVRLTAPTSLTSIAADRVLQAGAGLTIVRAFPELAGLTIAATGRYTHWFAASNVATTLTGARLPCAGGVNGTCDQVSGTGTESDRLLTALTFNLMPVEGLTLTAQYAFTWVYRHDLVSTPVTGPDNSQHWRNAQYFTLAVAYDIVPWLNVQLGYQTSNGFARIFDDSGNVGAQVNPFWDEEASEIYLVATVPLDALYEELFPSEDEEVLTPEQLQRRRQGLAQGSSIAPAF